MVHVQPTTDGDSCREKSTQIGIKTNICPRWQKKQQPNDRMRRCDPRQQMDRQTDGHGAHWLQAAFHTINSAMLHTFWPQLVDCVNSQKIKSWDGGGDDVGGADELPSQGNKMLKQISAYCVFVWPQPERNDAHLNVAVKFLLKKDRPQVRQQLQSALIII